MPKEFYKGESSKEWFTVSNAADKSSNDRNMHFVPHIQWQQDVICDR